MRKTSRECATQNIALTSSGVTLVMPVSGNRIINQVYLANEVIRLRCRLARILATSGGSITAMMMLLCDVASVVDFETYSRYRERLRKILKELDRDWYCQPSSSFQMISTFKALSTGSLYLRGNGAEMIKSYEISVKGQPEVVMGTHNIDLSEHQLWCTHSKKDSTIQLQRARYLNGDMDKIAEAATASCSVPTLVPSVKIGRYSYDDGGVEHASPLGDCIHLFNSALGCGLLPYKVVYICPSRYSSSEDPKTEEIEDDDVKNKMKASFAGMITKIHIPDRNNGIRAVGAESEGVIKEKGRGPDALMRALDIQETAERSFIELTPSVPVYVNFTDMEKGEALQAFDEDCRSDYYVRHWYLPSDCAR